MGFSTSGAVAILFVGALIAVSIAYPVVQNAHDQRIAAIEDRDDRALDLRNTAVAIEDVVYDSSADELRVNVTNDGATTLSVTETDLLVDGDYATSVETTVMAVSGETYADRTRLQPGERVTLTHSPTEDGAPDRVKVVTENGIAVTETTVEEVAG